MDQNCLCHVGKMRGSKLSILRGEDAGIKTVCMSCGEGEGIKTVYAM